MTIEYLFIALSIVGILLVVLMMIKTITQRTKIKKQLATTIFVMQSGVERTLSKEISTRQALIEITKDKPLDLQTLANAHRVLADITYQSNSDILNEIDEHTKNLIKIIEEL